MTYFGDPKSFQSMFKTVQTFPIPHDFTFYIGNTSYQIYKLFACMISPAVLHALQSDATIEDFRIDFDGDKEIFAQMLDIFSGKPLQISDSNAFDIYKIASQLQNEDLIQQCTQSMFMTLTNFNIFQKITLALKLNVSTELFIKYIANNFQELSSNEALFNLPIDILLEVLKRPELSIPDNTWLVKWIESAIEKHGDQYCVLIEALKFVEMSPIEICQILEMVKSTSMTSEICLQMKSFFINILRSKPNGISYSILTVEHTNRSDQLHGIIDKLTSKYGNIVEKGIVDVIVPCNHQMACDLLNYSNRLNSHWKNESNPEENWIVFDFKKYSIQLTAYTIRGCYCSEFQCRPKTWIISGSSDKENWTNLSEIKNCTAINKPYGMMTFEIPNQRKSFRFIKYTQLENNAKKLPHIVHLSAFEFFGSLARV